MRQILLAAAILALAGSASPSMRAQAQGRGGQPAAPQVQTEAQKTVEAVQNALGMIRSVQRVDAVNSVVLMGTGTAGAIGQAWRPDMPWPVFKLTSYKASIKHSDWGLRAEIERTNPDGVVQGGGGLPLAAPQKLVQVVAGKFAWNETQPGINPTPAQGTYNDRLLQFWTLTPLAAIKAARLGGADTKLSTEGGVRVLTFPAPGLPGMTLKAMLNAKNLIDRVETRVDNPVLGDMLAETTYADYRELDPERRSDVLVPHRIVQKQGGYPVLDLTVTGGRMGYAYVVFPIPENVEKAAAQPPAPAPVESQRVADGVWYLTGGSHHSVAVEFKDYMTVVEAPLNDERAVAVIAAVKKLVPSKPIRYVVNTHQHFDHSGGLRAFVAEGTTILTQTLNKPYYERVWMNPHTLNPDREATARRKPVIEAVADKRVLSDGTRSLELCRLQGSDHADTILIGYLPKERILIEADVYTPPAANVPLPAAVNAEAANLYANLERLRLEVAQILPIHGRQVMIADLRAFIGRATN
jgi:glyoxylase-like metal-dependent hydrolase (beta-lactamase superfamily II)